MLKIALVALSGLLAMQFMNADGVIVEDNTPTTLAAGSSADVTITINKGNVEGFAKLELELPSGLSAEAISTEDASFTFAGQKAKFIWLTCPEAEEFSITYRLTASSSASGNLMIKGVFAYIKDQQRVDYALKNKMVSIGSAGNDVAGDVEPDATETDTDTGSNTSGDSEENTGNVADTGGKDTDPANQDTDTTGDNTTISTTDEPLLASYNGTDMQCLRYIVKNSPTDYSVKLQVVNADLEGFCKITESVPAGFTVEEDDSDGAVVTLEPNGIKFVWFDSPSGAFEVTYRIRRFASGPEPAITGAFSFVKDNAPREQPVMNMGVEQELASSGGQPTTTPDPEQGGQTDQGGSDQGATDQTQTQPKPKPTPKPDPKPEPDPDPVVADTGSQQTTTTSTQAATTFPDPETGITYRVQLAAAHRTVGKSYFSGRHHFTEAFNIENHEGWVKYTTGSFEVYKQARDDRNRIRTSYLTFKGPFVAAYNDGMRITVQEALMISNQQWYK